MDAFHSSKHLCSWSGLVPQNNESAGKKKSSKISRAGVYLKPLLVQCANAAIKTKKNPYFRDKYLAIKKQRGHKKALIAVCRMMLTCIYNMLKKNQEFSPSDWVTSNQSEEMKAKQEKRKIDSAITYLQRKGFAITQTETELLLNSS